ncbi:hyaluronan and proteoglycan link protein 1-like [Anneissia japonica]|uniref:hyaluronan and proteoglycan link protein 1-like n=1 Tax=Anneissia japonica TaxID=1529436 RepID=UPI001425A87F|nr:hyaluronan and proteoglycan link protein 1-like [Anneissia japonica]
MAREDDYADAVESCSNHLGSIASYEQLHDAFQPSLENCKEGWLISGEIAFTEITGTCTLRPPEHRSNVFPCKTYQSGVYCHKEYYLPADTFDYLPKTQRIIRLTDSNSKKLNAEDAEICCRTKFSGHLATPLDVYNNSLSLGVGLCVKGWLSEMLAGDPCNEHMPPDFWLFPTGNTIRFEPLTNEYPAFCFVPLANQTLTYIDPFPPHRVMNGDGERVYSLNYYDADSLCKSRGGRMATRAEVQYAWQLGYDCCRYSWVESGEVIFPTTQPRNGCGWSSGVQGGYGVHDKNESYSVFCYMP